MSDSTSCGIGLGSVIAVILSWTTWKSIMWAILHGILSLERSKQLELWGTDEHTGS